MLLEWQLHPKRDKKGPAAPRVAIPWRLAVVLMSDSDSESTQPPGRRPSDVTARGESDPGTDPSDGGEAPSPDPTTPPPVDDRTVISSDAPIPLSDPRKVHSMQLGNELVGERLGHFQLQAFIGGGGMGAVFRALDTRLNRTVAVKVLSTGQPGNEETEKRFQNEAQSVARLDHENIARVYYVGEDRGLHYIVFEHIEGENIRDLVHRQGPFSLADAINHVLQIAEALVHASQRDVVHRDIKPSNILITPAGRAKLVDMGLARLHHVDRSDSDLTASGVTLGTFDYISPEQARDPRNADVRSDLYSLGCTLYFMLTGRPPFPEGTVLQKLLRHQGDEAPDPREFRPELPEEVSQITSKLLAKSPRDRYQQPHELIGELISLAERYSVPLGRSNNTVWVASGSPDESTWRRHLPWLVPAVLLLAIVLVVERMAWYRGDDIQIEPLPRTSMAESDPLGEAVLNPEDVQIPAGLFDDEPTTVDSIVERELGGLPVAVLLPTPTEPVVEPAAEVRPAQPNELIVDPDGEGTYSTIAAAVRDAVSGDIIELRYNGRHEERPIALDNLRLTIRAGEGFAPQVVFRPGPENLDPSTYARSMLRVTGGELSLVNIDLQLEVPRSSGAERWSLIETRGDRTVRLTGCTLSVQNAADDGSAYHTGVSFFDVKAPLGTRFITFEELGVRQRPVTIRLENCIARGEASFLYSEQSQPIDFLWDNGLLVISDRFLTMQAGVFSSPGRGPQVEHAIAVELRHLTAVVLDGLLSATTTADARYQMNVEFKCSDSIIVAADHAALIEQHGAIGPEDAEEYIQRLSWKGTLNFYEQFNDFVTIHDSLGDEILRLDYDSWLAHWETMPDDYDDRPRQDAVVWDRLGDVEGPLHRHTVADYVLRGSPAENPARTGASDGSDVGLRAEDLPTPTGPVRGTST